MRRLPILASKLMASKQANAPGPLPVQNMDPFMERIKGFMNVNKNPNQYHPTSIGEHTQPNDGGAIEIPKPPIYNRKREVPVLGTESPPPILVPRGFVPMEGIQTEPPRVKKGLQYEDNPFAAARANPNPLFGPPPIPPSDRMYGNERKRFTPNASLDYNARVPAYPVRDSGRDAAKRQPENPLLGPPPTVTRRLKRDRDEAKAKADAAALQAAAVNNVVAQNPNIPAERVQAFLISDDGDNRIDDRSSVHTVVDNSANFTPQQVNEIRDLIAIQNSWMIHNQNLGIPFQVDTYLTHEFENEKDKYLKNISYLRNLAKGQVQDNLQRPPSGAATPAPTDDYAGSQSTNEQAAAALQALHEVQNTDLNQRYSGPPVVPPTYVVPPIPTRITTPIIIPPLPTQDNRVPIYTVNDIQAAPPPVVNANPVIVEAPRVARAKSTQPPTILEVPEPTTIRQPTPPVPSSSKEKAVPGKKLAKNLQEVWKGTPVVSLLNNVPNVQLPPVEQTSFQPIEPAAPTTSQVLEKSLELLQKLNKPAVSQPDIAIVNNNGVLKATEVRKTPSTPLGGRQLPPTPPSIPVGGPIMSTMVAPSLNDTIDLTQPDDGPRRSMYNTKRRAEQPYLKPRSKSVQQYVAPPPQPPPPEPTMRLPRARSRSPLQHSRASSIIYVPPVSADLLLKPAIPSQSGRTTPAFTQRRDKRGTSGSVVSTAPPVKLLVTGPGPNYQPSSDSTIYVPPQIPILTNLHQYANAASRPSSRASTNSPPILQQVNPAPPLSIPPSHPPSSVSVSPPPRLTVPSPDSSVVYLGTDPAPPAMDVNYNLKRNDPRSEYTTAPEVKKVYKPLNAESDVEVDDSISQRGVNPDAATAHMIKQQNEITPGFNPPPVQVYKDKGEINKLLSTPVGFDAWHKNIVKASTINSQRRSVADHLELDLEYLNRLEQMARNQVRQGKTIQRPVWEKAVNQLKSPLAKKAIIRSVANIPKTKLMMEGLRDIVERDVALQEKETALEREATLSHLLQYIQKEEANAPIQISGQSDPFPFRLTQDQPDPYNRMADSIVTIDSASDTEGEGRHRHFKLKKIVPNKRHSVTEFLIDELPYLTREDDFYPISVERQIIKDENEIAFLNEIGMGKKGRRVFNALRPQQYKNYIAANLPHRSGAVFKKLMHSRVDEKPIDSFTADRLRHLAGQVEHQDILRPLNNLMRNLTSHASLHAAPGEVNEIRLNLHNPFNGEILEHQTFEQFNDIQSILSGDHIANDALLNQIIEGARERHPLFTAPVRYPRFGIVNYYDDDNEP